MNLGKTINDTIKHIKNHIIYLVSNNKAAVRFLSIFFILTLFFFIFFYLIQDSLTFLLSWTASTAGLFANILGLSVTVNGVILASESMNFEIIHECTGIFAIMIITSSIIAYPTALKEKMMGILFVIPLILGLNLIRIIVIIYIGKYHTHLFEYVHSYLWQGTFIIFIILAFFLWIELVVNR